MRSQKRKDREEFKAANLYVIIACREVINDLNISHRNMYNYVSLAENVNTILINEKKQMKYRNTINISVALFQINKPIFTAGSDFSSDDLLSKCLHSQKQNTIYGLNAIIWSRYSKDVLVE